MPLQADAGRHHRWHLSADNFDVGAPGPAQARTHPISPPALAIALVTGILIALEVLRPVHRVDAGARAAAETAIAVAALLTSRLLIEIFRRTRQLRELLLVLGVLALSFADLLFWAGPVVAGVRGPTSGAVRLSGELIGALAFAAAALVPPTAIVEPVRGLTKAATVLGLGVIAVGTMLAELIAVHPRTSAATAATASPAAHPVAITVQAALAAILVAAGFAFAARPWRAGRGTEFLAGASLLLAAAGIQFLTAPNVLADWVTPRDGVRVAASVLLLGGACLRYTKVRRHDAHAAVCSERERIARDLHDGLAQDLACITTEAQRRDCQLGPEHPLMLATRDALAELRRMIADLTASTTPTSEAAVGLIEHELGNRFVVQVAALGGDARHVDVASLRRAGTLVVPVADDTPRVPELPPAGVTVRKLRAGGVSGLSADWSLRAGRRRPA